jgi:hypothetical protein
MEVTDSENRTEGWDATDELKVRGADSMKTIIDSAEPFEVENPEESETGEWPGLVSIDTPLLPRLNPYLLPGWAGEYVSALSASTETPPELAAFMVLATCSTAAARRLRVQLKSGHVEPCNLWLVVALPPGNRKSAVQAAATEPLVDWESEHVAGLQGDILRISSERETLVARARELRQKSVKNNDRVAAEQEAREAADIEAHLPDVPRMPQLWTSDATPERMGTLLAHNDERMAWLSSEGGVFDMLQGRYTNGISNLDLMLKSWSGDAERVDRKSRPTVYLKNPLLTIGLTPQPEVLRGLATKSGFLGRGLVARFAYLLPPSPLGYRTLDAPPIPDCARHDYSSGVRAMLEWEPVYDERGEAMTRLLQLSGSAHAEWLDFAHHIESGMKPGGDFEHITDWAGKVPGVAVRMAGVLHGIEHAHGAPWEAEISTRTMADALEIIEVIAHHSKAVMDWMGADQSVEAASRVWRWVVQGHRDQFTVHEAHQALKGTFSRVKGVREALAILEERGYARIDDQQSGKPGRPPSPTVRVRPDIVETWR